MRTIIFPQPEQLLVEKVDDYCSIFTLKPLDKGYGITLGNALRRVLLSSMEGYAITSMRVSSVVHEYETIKGVKENIQDISKNLQEVRFTKAVNTVEDKHKISIPISNKTILRAEDILQATSSFTTPYPELVICHIDEDASFELEVTVERGRDYRNARDNQPENPVKGQIPINAIFTPIRNVKYTIEKTRVGRETDYDSLVLEVQTDGTIQPDETLERAASILIEHYSPLAAKHNFVKIIPSEEHGVADKARSNKIALLNTSIEQLPISARANNCLTKANILTLGDLVQQTSAAIMKLPNFGRKTYKQLQALVKSKGLEFGMDVSAYNLKGELN